MKNILFILVFFTLSYSFLPAQVTDFNITGAGARAAGFGGAFIGVADDATAISWNPAGLAQLEKLEASIVGKYASEELDYKNTSMDVTATSTQTHGVMNFLSVATPIGKSKVVGAIAWQQEIDGYYKQDEQESKGGIEAYSFGLAKPYGKIFSLGVAGNIWAGKVKSKNPADFFPYDATESFSGFNMIFGVMADLEGARPASPVKFGLTIRTPFDLKDKYRGSDGNADFKLEMPWMIGMGTSYRFSESFTMAMDFESRLYSGSSISNPEMEDDISISQHDLNQVRVGAEYLILGSNYRIPLRFGLQTVPTVYSNLDNFNQEKDQVIGSGVAIGTGFITNMFSLDATLQAQTYQQKLGDSEKLTYTNVSIFISGILYFK
jgi:long-subunit fatty acid transport protein